MQESIFLQSDHSVRALTGVVDENIRIIEKLTKADVCLRDKEILIKGDTRSIEECKNLIMFLLQEHDRGKSIAQLLANELGIRHWKISLVYGIAQITIGLSVILIKPMGAYAILSTYFVYGMMFFLISILIRKKVTI